MSIKLSSFDQYSDTSILRFNQNWNWPEFYETVDKLAAQIQSVNQSQIVIFDFGRSLVLPKNLVTHCPAILSKLPQNVDLLLVVSYGNMMSQIHELVELAQGGFYHTQLVFLSHRDSVLDAIHNHHQQGAATG